jgi:hypothetical protein
MVSAGRPPDGSTDIVSLLALVLGGNNAFLVVSELLHVMNTISAPLSAPKRHDSRGNFTDR